ncbi:FAD dependent oxidoreductase [Labedaea rhizosphaerae]|uniref:FAD dependent oxidoreductase n=2 Tax=Labedaea rhizosphaerae TaxID=598644 RepID=A0A4R6S399_LABRH|nr:FAD dependent oxidoreductase [Labedaea rhizosphaerae]
MLTWRLAQLPGAPALELRVNHTADATAASGGAVKAFEGDARQRELATESLAELLSSPTLQTWSGYQRSRFLSMRAVPDGLDDAVAAIDARLPGGIELADGTALADWHLQGERTVVIEHHAGYTTPGAWRDRVLDDCAKRGVTIVPGVAGPITERPDGSMRCGGTDYDLVVLATGPWTPQVLRANGFSESGYRTKSVQYALHDLVPGAGWRPPSFSDEVSGLYARPTAGGGVLVGLPAQKWDVDPDHPPLDEELLDRAAGLLTAMLPRLRLGRATRRVAAADCYRADPGLALAAVPGTTNLFTFTGGSGGSVKTALAASTAAATALGDFGATSQETTVGRRKGRS